MDPVDEPSVWLAENYRHSDDWVVEFTERHIAELNDALNAVRAKSLGSTRFTRDDFPLPLTPVNTTSLFLGISKLRFLRLCSRAPLTLIFLLFVFIFFLAIQIKFERALISFKVGFTKIQTFNLRFYIQKTGLKIE